MKPMPLKWRISLLICLVLVTVIAVLSAVAYHELGESLMHNLDRSLHQMARTIDAEAQQTASREALDREVQLILNQAGSPPVARYRVWLDGADRDLLASDPPDSPAARAMRQLPRRSRGERPLQSFSMTIGQEPHRAVWLRQSSAGGARNTVVAYPLAYARNEMGEFLRTLLILGGAVVAGAFVLSTLAVLWGLRPIRRTAEQLRGVSHPDAGSRTLRTMPVPPELDPFKNALIQMLERIDGLLRRQQEFTADASHELRTPLALAKSALQAVRMRSRSEAAYQQAIDDALSDLRRMELLIGQLLALARLEGQPPDSADEPVPLNPLLEVVAAEFSQQTNGRVTCEDAPAVAVRGDPGQLRQLFGNLVDNAVHHGPPDGPVRIRVGRGDDSTCTVTVHDAGGAIPPAELPRIFERFYRADASRTRATGGAGLGLAIARAIVLRLGGSIEITSAPADGTQVRVRLPVAPAE